MHCLLTGGHRGVTKTYNRIKYNYYWENLKSDSTIHTTMFTMSIEKISTSKNQTIHDNYRHHSSFDKIAMDIVGPLKLP